MDNIITIRLKEDKSKESGHDYKIEFASNPTLSELAMSILVLQEVLEHNYDRISILTKMAALYSRLEDVEEVRRI